MHFILLHVFDWCLRRDQWGRNYGVVGQSCSVGNFRSLSAKHMFHVEILMSYGNYDDLRMFQFFFFVAAGGGDFNKLDHGNKTASHFCHVNHNVYHWELTNGFDNHL